MCSITRSKYGTYKEYHTSADNLEFISPHSLYESYSLFKSIINQVESQRVPKTTVLCEPQLGKRGLYPNLSTVDGYSTDLQNYLNVISYLDGAHSVEEIAEICGLATSQVEEILRVLLNENLIDI
jgi:aminopeptidase-like protein